jgi:exosortase A-associated hydrolase 1/exosortase A-associated hydrolase 2
VLHVPAFAEEMNRSRSMVNRQARMLVEQGLAVVVPDLYGTGDSSGEFENAEWPHWQQDINIVLDWIQGQGGTEVCLWGLRLGGLLALDVAKARGAQIRHLVLWQPVCAGRHYITQFLRLRMVAGGRGGGETTAALRERLREGETLEIAGYDLAPTLVSQLDEVDAELLTPQAGTNVFWVEIATQGGNQVRPVSRHLLDSWRQKGLDAESLVVQGDPFWMTHETALAPELLEATTVHCLNAFATAVPARPLLELPDVPTLFEKEKPLVFECEGEELVGILNIGSPSADTAVLVVVGGPQYRVGGHRQYVRLARFLGGEGIPVLRFDYRGMGDSSGEWRGFESIGMDIARAIDVLQQTVPNVKNIIIWGLCDAATAACSYAATDKRVKGLVLLNPWVYSTQGRARAYLKYYYPKRLLSGQFWRDLLMGKLDVTVALKSMFRDFQQAKSTVDRCEKEPQGLRVDGNGGVEQSAAPVNFAAKFRQSLARLNQPVLLVLSGDDLTAAEFRNAIATDLKLRNLLAHSRVTRRELPEADHTFSRHVWRDQVAQWTVEWIASQ